MYDQQASTCADVVLINQAFSCHPQTHAQCSTRSLRARRRPPKVRVASLSGLRPGRPPTSSPRLSARDHPPVSVCTFYMLGACGPPHCLVQGMVGARLRPHVRTPARILRRLYAASVLPVRRPSVERARAHALEEPMRWIWLGVRHADTKRRAHCPHGYDAMSCNARRRI